VIYLLAAVGGGGGALARWGLAEAVPRSPGGWPWATLAVNLAGCLLIGVLLAVLAARRPDDERLQVLLGTGVLGGFTTFSAFAVETTDLLFAGSAGLAIGYVLASVLGGVLAVAAGSRAGSVLAAVRR
jgi:fluoride exporter